MDAGNLLKPPLARGNCIASAPLPSMNTESTLRKILHLSGASKQSWWKSLQLKNQYRSLRGLKERYEVHHGVRIKDSALVSAAVLSHRYITDRSLPDKAIDLIDEAAARMRIEIDSMPSELDELERRRIQLEIEREALKKERTMRPKSALKKSSEKLPTFKKRLMGSRLSGCPRRKQSVKFKR